MISSPASFCRFEKLGPGRLFRSPGHRGTEDENLPVPVGCEDEKIEVVCVFHEAFLSIHAGKQIVNTDF